MLRAARFIARTDLRTLLTRRETLVWTFLMPPVFFFFIGSITGGFGGSGGSKPVIGLDASPAAGPLVAPLERRLAERGFDVRRVPPDSAGDVDRVLSVPAGFSDSLAAGRRVRVDYRTGGESELAGRADEFEMRRALYTLLADVVVAAQSDSGPTAAGVAAVAGAPREVTLDVRQAGRRREPPTGFQQAVPGTMVMFTLLVMLTSGAVLLVIERRRGLLRRLASAPLPRGGVVLGKWSARMVLGIIQIAFAMLLGTLLFHVGWGADGWMVALVLLAWGALAAALGILLGNLARTEGQAIAIGVLSSNALAALGGCWWPIEVTPRWMQSLARALPTGWTMEALHRLAAFQAGPASAAPQLLALLVAAVATGWLATRTFRFL